MADTPAGSTMTGDAWYAFGPARGDTRYSGMTAAKTATYVAWLAETTTEDANSTFVPVRIPS